MAKKKKKKKTEKKQQPDTPAPEDRLSEPAPKTAAANACFVVVVYGAGLWGKGRSIEQALSNMPSYKATDDVFVTGVYCPKGCYIHPDSVDGYSDVWIDDVGRLRIPTGASTFELSEKSLQFRKISPTKKDEW